MLSSAFGRLSGMSLGGKENKVVECEEKGELQKMISFGNGSADGTFVGTYGKHSPNFKLSGNEVDIDGVKYNMGQPLAGRKDDLMQTESVFGTCKEEPSEQLRWGVDRDTASKIACYNMHYSWGKAIEGVRGAGTVLPHTLNSRSMMGTGMMPLHYWDKWHEQLRYWENKTSFLVEEVEHNNSLDPVVFYDTASKKPLFVAPRGRTWDEFLQESKKNERLSFREDEIVQENVRELWDGAVVSVDGTHLGHIKPDKKGIRYGINIVSVAG